MIRIGLLAPAMAAGVTDRLWGMADIVKLIDNAAPRARAF